MTFIVGAILYGCPSFAFNPNEKCYMYIVINFFFKYQPISKTKQALLALT